jgi:transposase
VERIQLARYLDAGLSLEAIAELTGRHPSTVSYWLKKFGLKANGAARHSPRGGIRRELLEPLVRAGLPQREIAQRLNRSQHTVRYWMRKFELGDSSDERERLRDEAERAGLRSFVANCRVHGECTHVIESSGRVRCRDCRHEAVSRHRRRVKQQLVEEAGGKCLLCGYAEYHGALQFHHRDPAEKSFHLAAGGITRSIGNARLEAAKCVLLCANCHAEVEAGLKQLP